MNKPTARERILARLHASGTHETIVPETPPLPALSLDRDAKVERLAGLMAAVRTEVHVVDAGDWTGKLKALARERGWKALLYGPGGPLAPDIQASWSQDAHGLPKLRAYDGAVETFKADLFEIDAGITSVRGGVADAGALVLWPSAEEPRL
ncbi:MAG TPA: LUD domain-containing protein, partial [Desulfosarcina sp.]|nr:LUD domain-containing protein [Desulfosarcina sp.]